MKKLFSTLMLVLVALTVQAQILQPVKWKIQLNDSGSAEKEIVFTATADKGWHLYDQDLPEGGPVSTSFTFETLKGAELIGKPTSSVKPTTVYDELFAMNLRWYLVVGLTDEVGLPISSAPFCVSNEIGRAHV